MEWRIERNGRAWESGEAMARWALTPDRLEMLDGRLLWDDESRLNLLGLLLENVGADATVRLGRPQVWVEAADALRSERVGAPVDDPELPIDASGLTPEAQICASLLGRLMSDLSEDYWCASWLSALEYELWAALRGEKSWIRTADIAQLRYLSDRCGGWIVYHDDPPYRRYLPLTQWSALYDAWCRRDQQSDGRRADTE